MLRHSEVIKVKIFRVLKRILTKNSEADFSFGFPSFVPGNARIISLVQLLHIHYSHLRAILIEGVLIPTFQQNIAPVRTTKHNNAETQKQRPFAGTNLLTREPSEMFTLFLSIFPHSGFIKKRRHIYLLVTRPIEWKAQERVTITAKHFYLLSFLSCFFLVWAPSKPITFLMMAVHPLLKVKQLINTPQTLSKRPGASYLPAQPTTTATSPSSKELVGSVQLPQGGPSPPLSSKSTQRELAFPQCGWEPTREGSRFKTTNGVLFCSPFYHVIRKCSLFYSEVSSARLWSLNPKKRTGRGKKWLGAGQGGYE